MVDSATASSTASSSTQALTAAELVECGDDFDAYEFIDEKLRTASLPALREQTRKVASELRSELMGRIHRDYDALLTLLVPLEGVAGDADRAAQPLLALRNEVEALSRQLQLERRTLESRLREVQLTARQRERAEILIASATSLEKVNRLLDDREQGSDAQQDSELLLRIASEVAALRFRCSVAESLPPLQHASATIRALQRRISERLRTAIATAIPSGDVDSAKRCFQAFVTLKMHREAEAVMREEIVEPTLASADSLTEGLDALQPLLAPYLSLPGLAFAANAVMPPLAEHTRVSFTGTGMQAVKAFHAEHERVLAVLERVAGLFCPTEQHRASLLRSEAYRGVVDRLNPSAVAATRAHVEETIAALEGAALRGPDALAAEALPAMQRHFRNASVIRTQQHRHVELVLGVAARSCTLAREAVQRVDVDAAAAHRAIVAAAAAERVADDVARGALELLAEAFGPSESALARERIPGIVSSSAKLVADDAVRAVADAVTAKITEAMRETKSVVAVYRMTGRAMPTAASGYVGNVFAFARELRRAIPRDDARACALYARVCDASSGAAASAIRTSFTSVQSSINDFARTLRKLQRLQKSKQSGEDAEGDDDAAKMHEQLRLDARAIAREAEELQLHRGADAWKNLLQ